MNLAEQLAEVLAFLEEQRKGFRYSLTLSRARDKSWTVAVTGTSLEDKSLPHDFLSVTASDFESLPALVKAKSEALLAKEIEAKVAQISNLQEACDKLDKLRVELNQLLCV